MRLCLGNTNRCTLSFSLMFWRAFSFFFKKKLFWKNFRFAAKLQKFKKYKKSKDHFFILYPDSTTVNISFIPFVLSFVLILISMYVSIDPSILSVYAILFLNH